MFRSNIYHPAVGPSAVPNLAAWARPPFRSRIWADFGAFLAGWFLQKVTVGGVCKNSTKLGYFITVHYMSCCKKSQKNPFSCVIYLSCICIPLKIEKITTFFSTRHKSDCVRRSRYQNFYTGSFLLSLSFSHLGTLSNYVSKAVEFLLVENLLSVMRKSMQKGTIMNSCVNIQSHTIF